jgi:hypothetical protein
MKFLWSGLLFFVFGGALSAQGIFIPFKGTREIARTADINNASYDLTKIGEKCGDYFFSRR